MAAWILGSLVMSVVGFLAGLWVGRTRFSASELAVAHRLARAERGARTVELAAALAHEIKNPLTPILGYARLLLQDVRRCTIEPGLFEKGLSIIEVEAARIETRVMAVLGQARPVAGKPVELQVLVHEIASIARVLPGVAEVRVEGFEQLPRVHMVEDRLQSALVNLVENAAEAMELSPGCLYIKAWLDKGEVQISIADQGPGLGDGTEDAMKPFFTTKAAGNGLGLGIAQSAVEDFGGTLTLSDREDGQGAVAVLSLPLGPL